MTDENVDQAPPSDATDAGSPADPNQQLEIQFPSTDDFPSYDEVDSDQGQAELPADSFDETAVVDSEGCGCTQ